MEADCLLLGSRVVVPSALHEAVLRELHESHQGVSRMKALARSHVWWPGIDKDIEALAKSCPNCLEVKSAPPGVILHPWVWPSRPWSRVHIDFVGPIFGKMYFVLMDAHSKWPEAWEMASTSSTKTIAVLNHLFSCYGFPDQVVLDNGPQFTSRVFRVPAFLWGEAPQVGSLPSSH